MRNFAFLFFLFFSIKNFGQEKVNTINDKALRWADSVYQSLNNDERIAQLMVVRLSSINLQTKEVTFYEKMLKN